MRIKFKSLSKKRIFIDCTDTYFFGSNTGIQRVVRNIIKTAPKVSSVNEEILPVVWAGKKFIIVPDIVFVEAAAVATARGLRERLRSIIKRLPKFIKRILRPPFLFFWSLSNKFRYARQSGVKFRNGDVILFPDASWNTFNFTFKRRIEKIKNEGVKIGFIFHDIIPVRNPEYFLSEQQLKFNKWFVWALKNADFFVADSDATRNDVVAFAKEKEISVPANAFNYPAISFDFVKDNRGKGERLAPIFKNSAVYVFISTIEVRKNHEYAISAFEILWWQKNFPGKLFIIGRVGWLCDKTIKRIFNHPEYNKRLFMINDVDDGELLYAYKNAAGVVFTSHYEGFGLPIIEGLSFGLPVFASDIPVHREIGEDKVHYCDLSNPGDLAQKINEHTNEHAMVCSLCKAQKNYKYEYAWEDSTRNLLRLIKSFCNL